MANLKRGSMNKTELVDRIALDADISKVAATKALDAVLGGVAEALSAGDSVVLAGFGNFVVKERAARKGRNPKTGEEITIKAAKAVNFKAGKALKDRVQKEG
jgi:DNA-binding protein HU-beta